MHDSIMILFGNYTATTGPTIPIFGGIPIAPLVGSFLGIVASVIIAIYTINRHRNSTEKHINTVKNASSDQIEDARKWRDLKRKLQLDALIRELQQNIALYMMIAGMVEKKEYAQLTANFILTIIEKCLVDTPIDDVIINAKLLNIYYILKVHDNRISLTRIPGISNASLENLIDPIAKDFIKSAKLFIDVIENLEKYEQEKFGATSHQGSIIEPKLMGKDLRNGSGLEETDKNE